MIEQLLLGAFVFGLVFTVATAVLGASDGALDALGIPHGHGDVGPLKLHGADLGHHDTGPLKLSALHWLLTFNLTAMMGFLTFFGGIGWLVLKYGGLGPAPALGAGGVAGLAAYKGIAGLYRWLRSVETPLRAEDFQLQGTVARVSVPSGENGVGEIVFTLQGVQRVEGARSADGRPLARGAEVVITSYERGIAVVHDAKAYLAGLTESKPAAEAPRLPQRESEQDS